jgi:glycerophosphoryl diester phosphodiesterase
MKRIFVLLFLLTLAIGLVALLPGYRPANHAFFSFVPKGQVEIMAHGAGQGVAPTNTLLAAQTARRDGADVLEVDVQLTRDGVLLLHHDDTLDRTTDLSGPVAAYSWAQLSARDQGGETVINGRNFSGAATKVARLDDVLAAVPEARWNIEIKNPQDLAATQLCKIIAQAGITKTVLVASFHDATLAKFRAACPDVATSMSPKEIQRFYIAARLGLARFVKTPAVAVQVPVAQGRIDLTNGRFINALKARNIKLHYWTINDEAQMRALIDKGADGILTDFVARGREARSASAPDVPAR